MLPEVREKVISTRSVVRAHWGDRGVSAAGMDGRTPVVADHLLHYGRNISSRLIDRLSAMDTRMAISPPPLDELRDDLDASLDELQEALDELEVEVRETQNAQDERNQATDQWDGAYSPVAAILENMFRLAGLDAQAERVRPTSRRRSGRLEPEDVDGGDQPDQPQQPGEDADDTREPAVADADDPVVEPS